MRKLLLVLSFLSLAGAAKAETQVYVTSSSCTYSGATVSTGTWKRRIDNFDRGATSVLLGRTELKITLPRGSQDINIGYDTNVSITASDGAYGRVLSSGAAGTGGMTYVLPVSDAVAVYAIAADAAGVNGQRINIEQCRVRKTDIP